MHSNISGAKYNHNKNINLDLNTASLVIGQNLILLLYITVCVSNHCMDD